MAVTVPYNVMVSRSHLLFGKCCCCIPLRVGCFILGYTNLVINIINTFGLMLMTALVGVVSHGFDHFDTQDNKSISMDLNAPITKPLSKIHSMGEPQKLGVLLSVVLCCNITWVLINISCIVGLHNRRPGPIRIYVIFASFRLLLSAAGLVYFVSMHNTVMQGTIIHAIDLILSAYFILIYYTYAVKLDSEIEETEDTTSQNSTITPYLYSIKTDKDILVVS